MKKVDFQYKLHFVVVSQVMPYLFFVNWLYGALWGLTLSPDKHSEERESGGLESGFL